jgi:hypothetical protein
MCCARDLKQQQENYRITLELQATDPIRKMIAARNVLLSPEALTQATPGGIHQCATPGCIDPSHDHGKNSESNSDLSDFEDQAYDLKRTQELMRQQQQIQSVRDSAYFETRSALPPLREVPAAQCMAELAKKERKNSCAVLLFFDATLERDKKADGDCALMDGYLRVTTLLFLTF